jgi:hypothetical protein
MTTAPVGLNRWRKICIGLWACWSFLGSASAEDGTGAGWRERFSQEVDRRLEVRAA